MDVVVPSEPAHEGSSNLKGRDSVATAVGFECDLVATAPATVAVWNEFAEKCGSFSDQYSTL